MYVCVLLSSACPQEEGEDPSVIGAISDAVKSHPNLTEVTVRRIVSRSLFIGVLKGVLQKADVRKVVAKESCIEYFKGQHSKTSDAMGPTCECMLACACIVGSGFTPHC